MKPIFTFPQPRRRLAEQSFHLKDRKTCPNKRSHRSPLSPLLWNILLDDLDRELERRGHGFCRYAEDGNIYVQSDRTGQRVRQSITAFLEQRLKLKVNAAKSAVARPWEGKFLGYSMTWHKKAKLKIASQSRQRLAEKIRLAFRRGRGQSMQPVMERLNSVLRGWMAYFRLSEVKNVLEELDGWLRRRLRTLLWRQWKRVYRRALNRMKAGIDKDRAWKSATHGRPVVERRCHAYEPCLPQEMVRPHGAGFVDGYPSTLPVCFMNRRMPNGTSVWWGRTAGVIPPPTRLRLALSGCKALPKISDSG